MEPPRYFRLPQQEMGKKTEREKSKRKTTTGEGKRESRRVSLLLGKMCLISGTVHQKKKKIRGGGPA